MLDEPTNHLDIYSIEVLEDSLEDYEGTLLVVSHDRHFLDSVCNKIYYLDENGLESFNGNYEDYKISIAGKGNEESAEKQEKKLNYEEQKEKNRRLTRLKNQLLKVEEDIEKLEEEKIQLSEQYDEAGRKNDIEKLLELQEKIAEIDRIEVEKMEEWERVNEELEGEEE